MLDRAIIGRPAASAYIQPDPRARWREAYREFRNSRGDPWCEDRALRDLRSVCGGRFIYPRALTRAEAIKTAYRPGRGLATFNWWIKLREVRRGMQAAFVAADRSRFYGVAFGRRVWQ